MAGRIGRRGVLKGVAAGGAVAAGASACSLPTTEGHDAGPVGVFELGDAEELHALILADGPLDVPERQAWVVTWDPSVDGAREAYGELGVELDGDRGLLVLLQRCPHMGCRVPHCAANGQFECPCHGSRFNAWGEWLSGPGKRGLDVFAARLQGGQLVIDTGELVPGRRQGIGPQASDEPGCVEL